MLLQDVPQPWIDRFNALSNNGLLKPSVNYDVLFRLNELYGKPLHTLPMGYINVPSGHIIACDPLTNMSRQTEAYVRTVQPGRYPIETKVAEFDTNYFRYIATRIRFKDNMPVHYELALRGSEDLTILDGESFIGCTIDSGLATIVDLETIQAYKAFEREWFQHNPNGNIYEDYFSHLFALNAMAHPQYQLPNGEWLNFTIPDTNHTIPMFQSGFGAGVYPVYWAFDEHSELCQLIIEFIDCSNESK